MEFISGEKFVEWEDPRIYYSPTDRINLWKIPEECTVIVTHNSDHSLSQVIMSQRQGWRRIKGRIKKWFSCNCDIPDDKFEPLPLGLENSEWHKDISKTEKIVNSTNIPWKDRKYQYSAIFNPQTNIKRENILNHYENMPNSYVRRSINGSFFDEYLEVTKDSQYVVSPNGNGIDTHRFWEALYLGCVPIVENIYPYVNFAKYFPIIKCKDCIWYNDPLKDEDNYVISINPQKFLDVNYWRGKINNAV